MAEKLTPAGLVVGLIIEGDEPKQEAPVTEEAPKEQPEKQPTKRGRKTKA